jgi:hypothetical protein
MAETLFADFLKSALDVPAINQYFVQHGQKTLAVLQKLRPEGRVDGGRFKLASLEGQMPFVKIEEYSETTGSSET